MRKPVIIAAAIVVTCVLFAGAYAGAVALAPLVQRPHVALWLQFAAPVFLLMASAQAFYRRFRRLGWRALVFDERP